MCSRFRLLFVAYMARERVLAVVTELTSQVKATWKQNGEAITTTAPSRCPFVHPNFSSTNKTATSSSNQRHSETMPTYRGITLTLHSQFDILPLPEYALPPASPLTIAGDADVPHILTPFLPGSHFWLSYTIAPPVPTSQFFLFKLSINGKKLVSWCAGGEEGYEGKVVCGLFEGGNGVWVERRAFRFAMDGGREDGGGCIEVDVHRAGGRRRVARRVEPWCESDGNCGGIE
jgi:hypothetical protein